MDEIKETKGTPSADAEKASKGSKETTPKAETKTYTQGELEKAIQADRISRGRDAKSFELREQSLTDKERALKEREDRLDAEEQEKLKDNPEALDLHKQRKAIKEERAELERDKAQHQAELNAIKESQKEIVIWQIASAKNIDPVRLKNLSEKFNVEGEEKLEELANEIASGKPEPETKEFPTPDSVVTSGDKKSLEGKSSRQLFKEDFQDKQKK